MIALFLPRWFMQKIGQQPLWRKSWGGVCELTQLLLAWNAVNKGAALTAPAAEGIWGRLAGRRSFVVYEKKFIFLKKCTICHNCKSIKKDYWPSGRKLALPSSQHPSHLQTLGPLSLTYSCSCSKAEELRWIKADFSSREEHWPPQTLWAKSIPGVTALELHRA